jgi:hypothetical protein
MCCRLDGDFNGLNLFLVGFGLGFIRYREAKVQYINAVGNAIAFALFELFCYDEEVDNNSVVIEDIDSASSRARTTTDLENGNMRLREEVDKESEELSTCSVLSTNEVLSVEKAILYPLSTIPVCNTIITNLDIRQGFSSVHFVTSGSNSDIFSATFKGKDVIVKVIKDDVCNDAIAKHEFAMELETLSRLTHPNIVKVGNNQLIFVQI